MFVKVTSKSKGKKSVRIVESVWLKGKCVQKTIRSMGIFASDKEVKKAKKLAEELIIDIKNQRDPVLLGCEELVYGKRPKEKKKKEKKKRVVCGIEKVFNELYAELGFVNLIEGTKKDLEWNDILKHCVLSRVFNPESKRGSVETLFEDFNRQIPLEKVYRAMDRDLPPKKWTVFMFLKPSFV